MDTKEKTFQRRALATMERINVVILSWFINIVSVNLLSGVVYASSAWVVWEELKESFDKVNSSRTFNLYKEIATLS